MVDIEIKIDTADFQRAFKEYRKVSQRGLAEDVNQKAYSVMIAATALTKRADKGEIREYMDSSSWVDPLAPVAAILINWSRGGGGPHHAVIGRGPGLYGQEMAEKVAQFTSQQADAVNFLRAGWLSAVYIFAKAIGKVPGLNAVRFLARYGFGKYGGGEMARPGWNPTATFYNMAFSRWTSTQDGVEFAEEGLERAVAQEVSRMDNYVARKMQQRTDKLTQAFFRI